MRDEFSYIAGVVAVIASLWLVAPHFFTEIWRNAHAVELAIMVLLMAIVFMLGMRMRGRE